MSASFKTLLRQGFFFGKHDDPSLLMDTIVLSYFA